MRVLRVYHAGRDPGHRARDRALTAQGVEVTLVVPSVWLDAGSEASVASESFRIAELRVARAGDVNRHIYAENRAITRVLADTRPDIVDIHEEPFSAAARQWLRVAPAGLPVVMYTAQNVSKRYPPPFLGYEREAYRRIGGLYPCSSQAAAVARGKGYDGPIEVIPLGFDEAVFRPGAQSLEGDDLELALVGRLVPEKGIGDAIHVLARVNETRPARLTVVGSGPEEGSARALAESLGVAERVRMESWATAAEVAAVYRRSQLVLVPSLATTTWTEQFGRVIVEAQAAGSVVAGYRSGSILEVAGDAAVLVPPGDVAALAAGILRLLDDPARHASLRDRGLVLSANRTWERVAASQAEFYRRVLVEQRPRLPLPRSPRERRRLAAAEFGPPATLAGGGRPFALPLLRSGGAAARLLAGAVDVLAELRASLHDRVFRSRS